MIINKVKQYIASELGWGPFLFAVLMASKVLGFYIGPVDLIAYAAILLLALKTLQKSFSFNTSCLLFIVYIPLSLLVANPNPVFNSWIRYASFLLLYIGVSPMIQSVWAINFRKRIFKASLFCCIILSIFSFFCYFMGINMMRSAITGAKLHYLVNPAGTFSGITSHSMLLGPISGIALLTCAYFGLIFKKNIFWLLTAMCSGSLLFAASRSSLLATIIGALCFLYFYSQQKRLLFKRLITISFVTVCSFPLWEGALTGITAKNKGDINQGINTDSRDEKWSYRIEEWKTNPLFGIGFVSVSERDRYTADGSIEPGSSWLALLSMTGTIGFILFCIIYIKAVIRTFLPRSPEGALIGGILILLGVHMLAEGHIFSAGSYLCFWVWLSIGRAIDYAPWQEEDLTDNNNEF